MKAPLSLATSIWCVLLVAACGGDDDSGGARDSAIADADSGANDGGADDAYVSGACDLSGSWVAQHNTRNEALGAPLLATNWSYHRIEQDGDHFTIVESFDCGYVVRGITDVSLSDATLEAMALQASAAVGTQGTFAPAADGEACDFSFDRIYSLRGADRARFLDAVWSVGDAPKELDQFNMPTNAADGMEDWDNDGHEGITQLTGIGDRYLAQLDWHAFHGRVPQHTGQFGGDGVIAVDYDVREAMSQETPALLRTSSTPMPPGFGFMVRGDDTLPAQGAHRELETCKRVQAIAIQKFGNPPAP